MAILIYNWNQPDSGPPDTYNLYEGPTSGAETLLASVAGTVTTYSHAHAPGTFAAYVTAVAEGTESAPSNEVTGVVGVVARPPAPTLQGFDILVENEPVNLLSGG